MTQFAQVAKGSNDISAWYTQAVQPAETETHYFVPIYPEFSFRTSPQPSRGHVLRLVAGAPRWVFAGTLDDAKAIAWDRVKTARDEAEAAPFEFEGNLCDPNKTNLVGAALRALMAKLNGENIARTWTLADNSEVVLSGDQLIGAGATLADLVDVIHERGRTLRKLIDAATTPEQALGYTWNMSNDE